MSQSGKSRFRQEAISCLLQATGFRHLVTVGSTDKDEIPKACRKSLAYLKKVVVSGATLDEELHELLSHQKLAAYFRSILITAYFTPELHIRFFAG